MAQQKKMIITIKDGEITSEIVGVKGSSCQNIDKFLDEIGLRKSMELKPDYFGSGGEAQNAIHIRRN